MDEDRAGAKGSKLRMADRSALSTVMAPLFLVFFTRSFFDLFTLVLFTFGLSYFWSLLLLMFFNSSYSCRPAGPPVYAAGGASM